MMKATTTSKDYKWLAFFACRDGSVRCYPTVDHPLRQVCPTPVSMIADEGELFTGIKIDDLSGSSAIRMFRVVRNRLRISREVPLSNLEDISRAFTGSANSHDEQRN